jgi:hypothetical protein
LRLLPLVVVACACQAPGWPRRVSTDDGTSPAFQVALTQATTRWNALAQEELGYDVFAPGEGDVVVHPYLHPVPGATCASACAEREETHNLRGWDPSTGIWASPDVPYLQATLTHELGHVLGLEDREAVYTPGSEGIMQWWALWTEPTFTVRDRYDLRAAARAHESAPGYPW